MQVVRQFRKDNFEGWSYAGIDEMTTTGARVRFAEDHMRVNLRCAVLERYISQQRQHFHLFAKKDLVVVPLFRAEETHGHFIERSDSGEMASAKLLFLGKLYQARHHFVARIEYDDKCFRTRA